MSYTNRRTYPTLNDGNIEEISAFSCRVTGSFKTYREQIANTCKSNLTNTVIDKTIMDTLDGSTTGANPIYYSRGKARGYALGENDVINPYYGYCPNDDIVHPFGESVGSMGMGRVYSENLDDTQRILFMAWGHPVYNSLRGFYNNAVDSNLADIMLHGPSVVSFQKIGRLLGWVGGKILTLPILPVVFLDSLINGVTRTPINKYYDFRNEMPLYFRMVNTLIATIAANFGFRDHEYAAGKYNSDTNTSTGSKINSMTEGNLYKEIETIIDSPKAHPPIASRYKFDMFRILLRKAELEQAQINLSSMSTDIGIHGQIKEQAKNTRDAYKQTSDSEIKEKSMPNGEPDPNTKSNDNVSWKPSWLNAFFAAYKNQLYNNALFIGFRIDKSVEASESLSNSIGDSEIRQTLNSKFQQLQSASFTIFNGDISGSGIMGLIESTAKGIATMATSAVGSLFGVGGASALATGAVRYDVPFVWSDSSFSKNYNFKIRLKTAYGGSSMAIMQDLYIPYLCLLVGACPRSTGPASYTSPMLCQAYSKGMFCVSLGMIENLSVSRGDDNHGWGLNGLPTSLTITFSIKDMSPAMYPSIGDGFGLFDLAVGNTTTMQDYMSTLSGLGLIERIDVNSYSNMRRRWKIFQGVFWENKLNPHYWGSVFGSKTPMKGLLNLLTGVHGTNR